MLFEKTKVKLLKLTYFHFKISTKQMLVFAEKISKKIDLANIFLPSEGLT